jgi:tetratricopeptide (TPR) repeat protein
MRTREGYSPLYRGAVVIAVAIAFLSTGRADTERPEIRPSFEKAVEFLRAGEQDRAARAMIDLVSSFQQSTPVAGRTDRWVKGHYAKGMKHLRSRYDSLAENEFREAIKSEPNHADSHYHLAFILGNRGDYEGMFREFWKAVQLAPRSPQKLRGLGGLSLLAKDTQSASAYYREALAQEKDSADVMRMLGLILVEMGNRNEGFSLLKKAIVQQPKDYSSLSAMGLAYALTADYEKAEEFLHKAIEINSKHPEALGRLGLVLMLQGHTDESIQRLREAVRLNPDIADLRCNLAKAYKLAGRLDDAEAQYRIAIEMDPYNSDAWYEMANILSLQKRLDNAYEAYEKAASLNPKLAGAHYKMGLLLAKKKNYSEAESQFKKTLRIDCDHADAYYTLAVLNEEQKKDYRTATHYYKMYLLYDSSSERAVRAIRWLERHAGADE